jgi:hypothetical protein
MVLALMLAARLAITVATPPDLVTPALASAAAAEASAVWRQSGLEIEWSIGDRPGWTPEAPMLYVLFSPRCTGETANALPLASIDFINGEPLHRIIVCRDEVDLVAAKATPGWSTLPAQARDDIVARVMGRAVAHEIGHYLFGRAHTARGLMRARHSAAEFCAADLTPFAISPPTRVARTLPLR